MNLRTNFLPRRIGDALVTTFVLTIIPLVYYFEMYVVLPKYYPTWGPMFIFHWVAGHFILFNVCSNLVFTILCDTSIRGKMLPSKIGPNWRFCSACESVVPPRSWHCEVCNVCILKRDHHCMFTSCCIGHFNHRYFLIFVLYIFLATVYATYHNIYFIYDTVEFKAWPVIMKIVFPLAAIFIDFSWSQIYLFLVLVIGIGGVFTCSLLYFHISLILRGAVTYERNQKLCEYDMGGKQNIIEVLGEKYYMVWISPFIESKLPSDGIQWNIKQTNKAK